ncbi:MAG: NAD-dependent epimerase/dehydratase family protein [Lachnospiraceae bacterium]|nr:NAD-dependent epimerase/dehydratase family protein [Lachnospiraceae bacterium]
MICISVSFKKTKDEIRQRFAFSAEEAGCFLKKSMDREMINGGVILSTCNRSELYLTAGGDEASFAGFSKNEDGKWIKLIEEEISMVKGISVNEIRKNCLYYQGKDAVAHLFKVVSGLDSMVLGEDEIFHQAKAAYQLSLDTGATDHELNILFQGAFNCGRLTRAKTGIHETPISIGTLTANRVEGFLESNIEKCGDDKGDRGSVLIVGATGQIGSIVAKDLIDKGITVIGTARSHSTGNEHWDREGITWIDFGKRYEYIDRVSAIVSATKSPHYTLTRDEFFESRRTEKPLLLVDLAMPYDIDRDIERESAVELMGIDHFRELSKKNTALKENEAEKMRRMVADCVEDTLKRLYIRNFQAMGLKAEEWFSKMIFYLKDSLDSDTLLKVLERIYEVEEGEKKPLN